MIRRARCFALLLGLLSGPTPAAAGSLHGVLHLPSSGPAVSRARTTDAVVWLEQVPERVERELALGRRSWFLGRRRRPPRAQLIARRQQYEPRVVVVAAGDSLEIRNADRVWHGTFSVSPARTFELGKRAPGKVDTLRFDQPGEVQVRCDIHPDMSATVVVTPNHAFARPGRAGEWEFPRLPEGAYVVRAWAPGLSELRREVSVSQRGDAVVHLRW